MRREGALERGTARERAGRGVGGRQPLLVGGERRAEPGLEARVDEPRLAPLRHGREAREGGGQRQEREKQEVDDQLQPETGHSLSFKFRPPLPMRSLRGCSAEGGSSMRGGWSRIVAVAAAFAALAAAMGLPGTLVGHKGEHAVGVAAPPVVTRTVVHATELPAPAAPSARVSRPTASIAPRSPGARLVAVRTSVASAPRVASPHVTAPISHPAPAPAPTPAAPAPAPAPAPRPPPSSPPPSVTPSRETATAQPSAPAPARPKPKSKPPVPAAPVQAPATKPGKGLGDRNHTHTGPPGQNKDTSPPPAAAPPSSPPPTSPPSPPPADPPAPSQPPAPAAHPDDHTPPGQSKDKNGNNGKGKGH